MILETKGLCKQFSGVYALKDINFSIKKGEIHGLVGENGAGKSTLIKILTGVYDLDGGEVFVDGEKRVIKNPVQSRECGISVIHQDRNLVPSFNGVENIYLGMKNERKGLCTVNFAKMKENILEVMQKYGIDVPLDKSAKELSPPQKTLIEIVRAVMTDCKLLILDEPTASLTDKETDVLFDVIKRLNENGTAILYITHRMEEIFQLTERITVFKNGEFVATVNKDEIDKDGLISLMTEKWTSGSEAKRDVSYGDVIFEASDVSTADGVVKSASFSLREGEILGVFGLGGAGRTELLEGIYGYKKLSGGKVIFQGEQIKKPTTSQSIKKGIVLIHEDRRGMSMIESRSIKDNIVLSTIDNYSKKIMYDAKGELADSREKVIQLEIKSNNVKQPTRELSGGNQQKVVFAKSLMTNPKVFLCDEPTQAVDVRTRGEIHKLLKDCAKNGSGVLYVTSDLKEMLEVADSILIMAGGKTWEQVENKGVTAEQILKYCYAQR